MSEKSNYYKYREFYYTEKTYPHLRKKGSDLKLAEMLNRTWDWKSFNKMTRKELIEYNKAFTSRGNEFIRGYYGSSYYKHSVAQKLRPESPAYRNYKNEKDALLPEYTQAEYNKMSRADLRRIVSESRSRLSNRTISLRYFTRDYLPYLSEQGAQYLSSRGILKEREATYLLRSKDFQDVYWRLYSLLEESNDYKTSRFDSNQIQNAIIDEIVDKGGLNIENTEDNSYYEDVKQKIIDKFKGIYEEKEKEDSKYDTAANEFKGYFKSGGKR